MPSKKGKKEEASKRKAPEATTAPPASKKRKVEAPFKINVTLHPVVDVMVLGSGEVGQLGLGTTILGRKRPTLVPQLHDKRVLTLDAGGLHNAVLVQENEGDPSDTALWTWGCNDNKILGRETPIQKDETVDLSMVPDKVPVLAGKHIVDVTSGEYHMVALSSSGKLYAWGTYKDSEGFIGYTSDQKVEQDEPIICPGLEDRTIKQVSSGHNHTIALTSDGEVLIWGYYWIGRKVSDRLKRLNLRPARVLFPKRNGKEPKIVFVAAGGYHSFCIAADGTVFAWGLNNEGQLGIGVDKKTGKTVNTGAPAIVTGLQNKNITHIYAGQHHSLALGADGKVYSWGKGDYGQLGHGDRQRQSEPKEIAFFSKLNDRVIQLSTSDNHNTAVTESGTLYAWGFGERGQCGNATAESEGEDALIPSKVEGPQLRGRKVAAAGAGGQHTALLALPLPADAAPANTTTTTSSKTTPASA